MSRSQLSVVALNLRQHRLSIVTTNGAFDLLHVGHVRYLKEASEQGDVLIVGLNSDDSVRAYKHPSRPIIPQAQRAEMLLSLRYVDYVSIMEELTPIAFLLAVRPDVHVNGAEYGEDCVEAATARSIGARLHLVNKVHDLSTTAIVTRCSRFCEKEVNQLK